jgi:DNA-directed RNA polymerase subunit F
MKADIISEEPLTMAELKAELAQIKKRDEELGLRSNKTEEYLNKFVKLDTKKAEELIKQIEALDISRLKREHAAKIVDLLPTTSEEVKLILQGYTLTLNAENIKKIADVVANFK